MQSSHILPGQAADVRRCFGKPTFFCDLPGMDRTTRTLAGNIRHLYIHEYAHSTKLNVVQQNPAASRQNQIPHLSLAISRLSIPPI